MKIKYFLSMLILTLMVLPACTPPSGSVKKQVCFYDQCIQVEIARTQEERARGLQDRAFMEKEEGMLFIFPSSHRQSFWMKDTLLSLDIIWLDRDKKVVFIIPGVLPCETEQCPVYTPDKDAKYVLEVNAGVVAERGIRIGDQATF